jgi:genome maintenance exonuclease 1
LKTVTGKNGGRFYVVDEDRNIKLPSVTTILSATSDKSGLEEWKKRVGEAEAERISTFSANRGTFMHSLHEHYLNSRFIFKDEKPLQQAFIKAMAECNTLTPEEIECGKNLFLQFHNNSDFYERIESVMFQEIPLWSFVGGGYAGRMDLSIWGKSKTPKVIDFKTSRKPKREEWISNYKKQTAAYSIALHERYGIFPHSTEIWISCESGEVQLFEMSKEEIKHWFSEFYKDLKVYHESLK